MKLTVEVPDTLIRDQLCSGIEGGIRYWCQEIRGWKGFDKFQSSDTLRVLVSQEGGDPRGNKWFVLDFERAINLAIKDYPRLLDVDLQDAETGDMFIQLAAFGELVYS